MMAGGRSGEERRAVGSNGLSVPVSTAEYVRRDPGMSGFPESSFGRIPPDYVW